MTWRGLLVLFTAAGAFGQLPRSQAPMPRDIQSQSSARRPPTSGRLDATVTDLQGRPVAGLTAADFTLSVDGKLRKIESCEFRTTGPLRLAVVLDDLSLSVDLLNAARRSLRAFVTNGMKPGDEMAILRTGSGSGALDVLTSDKEALSAAIDRARFNLQSESSNVDSFLAGTLGVVRAALQGLDDAPGRKALLLISSGLREAGRSKLPGGVDRFVRPANRGAVVVYGVDLAPARGGSQLDLGFAAIAKQTGGFLADGGDVGAVLSRIAQDAAGHYLLTWNADDLPTDYVAGVPSVDKVDLRLGRADTVVRTRNGVFGSRSDAGGEDYHEVEREFERSIDADLVTGGVRVKVSPLLSFGTAWQIEAVVHMEARDVTFVKSLDGAYHAYLDMAVALVDREGHTVKDTSRSFGTELQEGSFRLFQEHGFGFTVVLPLPMPGSYQVRAVVRDITSGRIGSAREFVRVADWKDGGLLMSSIVIRGDVEKNADGIDVAKDPRESGSVRSFKAGHNMNYQYTIFNVAADAEKKSELELQTEIWRDGVRVSAGAPKPVPFPAVPDPSRRAISGVISLGQDMAPGAYVLRIGVKDKLSSRTTASLMSFDVRQ
jgi:VWFA-related protein